VVECYCNHLQRSSFLHTSLWNDYQKLNYTYNINGYLVGLFYEFWNGTQWQNTNLFDYTNDQNGLLLETSRQTWSGVDWDNYQKITYTYLPTAGIDQLESQPAELLHIYDLVGREILTPQKNQIYVYRYSDGSIRRVLEAK